MLLINKLNGEPEIFQSIQGEGRSMGEPAAFVRLKHCNLACVWCDSKDAWDPNCSLNEGTVKMTIQEVVDLVESFDWKDKQKRVVVTGGEPLLQKECIQLLSEFKHNGYIVEIEDNATLNPEEWLPYVDLWNSSPKLASSDNSEITRRNILALKTLVESKKAIFKFVITSEEDLKEILELQELAGIPNDMIWLMPEGYTKESLEQSTPIAEKIAKEHGWVIARRLHIELFGSKRGV